MVGRTGRTIALILPVFFTLLHGRVRAQQSSLADTLSSLEDSHGIRQVAISPDGQRVAWVEASGRSPHGIFVCTLASPASTRRRITADSGGEASDEREIAWSPDSRQLVFLSNAQTPDQLQLYVAKVTGGEARKLTDFRGALDSPTWSPDGKTLALLFTESIGQTKASKFRAGSPIPRTMTRRGAIPWWWKFTAAPAPWRAPSGPVRSLT
jgi:dipeptidyl aminopeptidase/acylaminoacyl peptidase